MSKEHEEKTTRLNPEELASVSGGASESNGNCYFVPETPIDQKLLDGELVVKCKSTCSNLFAATCACHGSFRCVNRYHRMTKIKPDTYGPYPILENNHGVPDKQVVISTYNTCANFCAYIEKPPKEIPLGGFFLVTGVITLPLPRKQSVHSY